MAAVATSAAAPPSAAAPLCSATPSLVSGPSRAKGERGSSYSGPLGSAPVTSGEARRFGRRENRAAAQSQ